MLHATQIQAENDAREASLKDCNRVFGYIWHSQVFQWLTGTQKQIQVVAESDYALSEPRCYFRGTLVPLDYDKNDAPTMSQEEFEKIHPYA